MKNVAYAEAATEVLAILSHTDEAEVSKISKKFIKFLNENSSKTYEPNFDFSKPIHKLSLKPKTEALLGLIYLKYWADEAGKEKFNKKIKENEQRYQNDLMEKYNPDNLFKNRIKTIKKNEGIKQEAQDKSKNINIIKKIFKR